MLASRFFISTLKEAPADAEIVSHQLMLRAGMIKRLGAGIYNYMPMGLRVIRRIEAIIREEMDRAGAIELLMPVVQPAELWQETGRFEKMGAELLRVKDRNDRSYVVQPTSEEVVTDIARQELRSYKQLPKNFYHIQTKFRDERRPRFGVMRGREFTMKDAYSFDRDAESAGKSYEAMVQAYRAIFERMGLGYRAVAADTGAIGGDRSHEFQVIAETGEDAIVYCPNSDYAANIELAEALAPAEARREPAEAPRKLPTPDKTRCEDVAEFLGIPVERTVKAIVLAVDRAPREPLGSAGSKPAPEIWLLLLRGDHTLNEVKASKLAGLDHGFRFATEAEIVEHFASPPGYLGPLGVARHAAAENSATAGGRPPIRIVADRAVAVMSDFVCGANEDGFHIAGVNWGSYLPEPDLVADIRNVVAGDPSPDGKGSLLIQRGIEVGHVFYLGAKYSAAMNATFLDETGKPRFFEMGCYGIGVTRIAGAAIEQNHDERGIVWPRALAPFEVVICPVGWGRSAAVREAASALYEELRAAGIDVVLDDRDERPGVMFAEWELIGIPLRVTVGDRGLKDGKLEIQARRDPPKMEASSVELSQVAAAIEQKLATL